MKILLVQFLLVLLNISQILAVNLEQNDTVVFNNWGGDITQFTIEGQKKSIQLNGNQLNKEASLFCSSSINNGKWSLRCKMEFNPSSQNYCEVFLCSSDTMLANTSGYSVVIGKTSDRIELVKHLNGTTSTILKSVDNLLNIGLVDVLISAERNDFGQWSLFVDLGKGSELIGNVDDIDPLVANYFIIQCVYTSTRSTKFSFSEMSCVGKTMVPKVVAEAKMAKHDLLFTEFMADPSPTINLPEVEYLEIFNRTEKAIFIGNLSLQLGENSYSLPTDSIYPHQYLTLTSESGAQEFNAKVRILGIKNFPLLSNSGFTIFLLDKDKNVVDNFVYTPTDYYGDKADGGWTLERKSIIDLTFCVDNWDFSTSLDGGTPSAQNSILSDEATVLPANLFNISYLTDSTFELLFSKEMSPIHNLHQWGTKPLTEIKSTKFMDSLYTKLEITLNSPIDTNLVYTIDLLSNFIDANDKQAIISSSQKFGKPITPQQGNLWINEVLFDSSEDGGEFVELYNSSSRIIETTYLRLQYNDGALLKLSELPRPIYPNGFALLFKENHSLKQFDNYVPNCNSLSMSDFPQLSNEQGNLSLTLTNGILIDSMNFASSIHHPSITNSKDVSLERCSYTINNGSSCFKSASSSAHYSTPGSKNSNTLNSYITESSDSFIFPSDYFSPNNDGNLDRFEMVRGSGYADAMVTVKIYSSTGTLLKTILENSLLVSNDLLFWDGIDESNQLREPGIYIALCNGYTANGETFTLKKAVIIAPK